MNTLDAAKCTCTPKTCDAAITPASCIPAEGTADPMPVAEDFIISAFAADDMGCKCEPATAPADMCAEKKYMGQAFYKNDDGTECKMEGDETTDSGATTLAAGALALAVSLLI